MKMPKPDKAEFNGSEVILFYGSRRAVWRVHPNTGNLYLKYLDS
jgi:hypothetical protein